MASAYQRPGWISLDEIAQAYRNLAKELNVDIAPVGLAWDEASKQRPDLYMYGSDREHSSVYGMYLATCVVYGNMYDPGVSTYVPSGITPEQGAFLRKIAWQTVSGRPT